jgi:hypothetical protein
MDEEMGDGMEVDFFCPDCGMRFEFCECGGGYDDEEDYEEYE